MKVDIIIAGAEKCGTTALHHFLSKHPKVIGSNPKELHFFNFTEQYNKGIKHYHEFFSPQPIFAALRGYRFLEASPSYIEDTNVEKQEITANRIYQYNPNAKIIVLVRNPAHRSFSAWKMYKERFDKGDKDWAIKWWIENGNELPANFKRRTAAEFENFDLYVKTEIESAKNKENIELNVLRNGHYHYGISVFQKIFGNNLIVLKNEDLNNNTVQVMEKLCSKLKLKQFNWEQFKSVKIFSGNYSDKPNDSTIKLLTEYYSESNDQLKLLTGISYE